jgi:hypothetical protein
MNIAGETQPQLSSLQMEGVSREKAKPKKT